MLNLVPRSQSPEETVLEVHGWISGENVPLLEQDWPDDDKGLKVWPVGGVEVR